MTYNSNWEASQLKPMVFLAQMWFLKFSWVLWGLWGVLFGVCALKGEPEEPEEPEASFLTWDHSISLDAGVGPLDWSCDGCSIPALGSGDEFEVAFGPREGSNGGFGVGNASLPSLGLQLSPDLVVLGFVRGENDEHGMAEASGMIEVGDLLVSVDGKRLSGAGSFREVSLDAEHGFPWVLGFRSGRGSARFRPRGGDFSVVLNALELLGAELDERLVVRKFDLEDSQLRRARVVSVGDRLIGVDGVSLLGMDLESSVDAVRRAFVRVPRRKVRCRVMEGKEAGPYCGSATLPQPFARRVVTFRSPGGRGGMMKGIMGGDDVDLGRSAQVLCGSLACAFSASGGVMRLLTPQTAARWRPSSSSVETNPGHSIAPFAAALFGGRFPCAPRPIIRADPPEACEPLHTDLRGAVLLARRGSCFFAIKAMHAQEAGASAIAVINDDGTAPVRMPAPGPEHGGAGTDVSIAVAMLPRTEGNVFWSILQDTDEATNRSSRLKWMTTFGTAVDLQNDQCAPLAQHHAMQQQKAADRRAGVDDFRERILERRKQRKKQRKSSGDDNTISSGDDNTISSGDGDTISSGDDDTISSGDDDTSSFSSSSKSTLEEGHPSRWGQIDPGESSKGASLLLQHTLKQRGISFEPPSASSSSTENDQDAVPAIPKWDQVDDDPWAWIRDS